MNVKGWIAFNALINKFHPDRSQAFSKFLSDDLQEIASAQHTPAGEGVSLFPNPEKAIHSIHYSWFSVIFSKLPEQQHNFFLSVLTAKQVKGIGQLIKKPFQKMALSALGRKFFLFSLFQKVLKQEGILPPQLLPESQLNQLLDIHKKGLVKAIDFMGIYELAAEMSSIKKEEFIEKVFASLIPQKQEYLKLCLEESDPFSLSPIEVKQWDGDGKKLNLLIHQKGLMRMAKALSGEHPSLIWYISSRLDTGRAKVIRKHLSEGSTETLVRQLAAQLTKVINHLSPAPKEG